MSDSTAVPAAHGVRPGQPAPELIVDLLSGGSYDLAGQQTAAFTMVVFFRGLHCPVCQVSCASLTAGSPSSASAASKHQEKDLTGHSRSSVCVLIWTIESN